jgi:hypothetical protein
MIPGLSAEEVVRAVIRGELPVAALEDVGIHMTFTESSATAEPSPVVVSPTVADIVQGLLIYQHDPIALQRWALFLMAASCVDFDRLEAHPEGDLVIGAIWDASFEGRVDGAVLETARRLAA